MSLDKPDKTLKRVRTTAIESSPMPASERPATSGILVLGMHRSGTSAVAGLLRLAGANLGSESSLLPANAHDNPTGYWERDDVVAAHDAFLEANGFKWDQIAGLDPHRFESGSIHTLRTRLREIALDLSRPGGVWLAKDPRMCLLLPHWLTLLENPACVVVVRDPREIATSMRDGPRGAFTSYYIIALWEKYLRTLLATLHDRRALFVSYAQLLHDPKTQCQRLLAGLRDLGIQGLQAPNDKIASFLDAKLRRSRPDAHSPMSAQQMDLQKWLETQCSSPIPVPVTGIPPGESPEAALFEFQRALEDCARRAREQAFGESHLRLQKLQAQLDDIRHERNLVAMRLVESEQQARLAPVEAQALASQLDDARAKCDATMAELDSTRHQRNATAAELNEVRHQRNVGALELDKVRHQRNLIALQMNQATDQVGALNKTLDALRASWSWKLTSPLRGIASLLRPRLSGAMEQRLYRAWYALPGLSTVRKRAAILWLHRHCGWLVRETLSFRMARQAQALETSCNASETVKRRMDADRAKGMIANMTAHPRISIVMPVYNVDRRWLLAAVESVHRQFYPHWQLCIADDDSTRDETRQALVEIERLGDARIALVRLRKNAGIAGASNAALKLATGEYVGLLDNDDELTRDALLEVALAINAGNPDIVYSDEDKLETDGRHVEPHFKPDFSPEYFQSINYLCHFTVIRNLLLQKIGGFRSGFDGAQDFDLLLRATENGENVIHIPKVLYHWRKTEFSTASCSQAKPDAGRAGLRALTESLQRRGTDASAEPGPYPTTYRVRRAIAGQPLVSIILPFRDKPELLAMCVRSILDKTDYSHFEILGIDNGSREAETHALMAKLRNADPRVRFVRHDVPFNYSAINNFAAGQARGEHLLFLNNDTEVLAPEWLRAMLEHSQRPEVGVVGAKLLYPDDRIQHAGVIVGIGGVAGHAHLLQPGDHPGYFARAQLPQEMSAVTFACAMTRREVFDRLGGLNEHNLTIAFNDIDYCLRARETGLSVVYTPYATLYHHESRTRGYEDNPEKQARFATEIAYMQQRHHAILEHGDPFYNPNLRLDIHDFSPRPGYIEDLPV